MPPARLGSVNMIAMTISVGTGMLAPFTSPLIGQRPLMISAALSITVWLVTFALPSPRPYLTDKINEKEHDKDNNYKSAD